MTEPDRPYFHKRTYLNDHAVKAGAEGVVAWEEDQVEAEMRREAMDRGFRLIGEPRHTVHDLHDPSTAEHFFGDPYPEFLPSRWMIQTTWPFESV